MATADQKLRDIHRYMYPELYPGWDVAEDGLCYEWDAETIEGVSEILLSGITDDELQEWGAELNHDGRRFDAEPTDDQLANGYGMEGGVPYATEYNGIGRGA